LHSYGHYLAYDVQWFLLGKAWFKIHIDKLDAFPPSEETVLTVPATALRVAPRALQTGNITGGRAVNKVAPEYPSEAKLRKVQGQVLLSGLIGTDGRIKKLEVLAGPAMLQKSALAASWQWVYEPTLEDGQPVEVETDITVVFDLGR
jgi:protein TonB